MQSISNLSKLRDASAPMLFRITRITNTFPKSTYSVYYKLAHLNMFKSIAGVEQIFVIQQQMIFKVINFENQEKDPLILESNSFVVKDKSVKIACLHQYGNIQIQGIIINKNSQKGAVIDVSLACKSKYQQFHKFRKKYRTLENLTRKIDFKIDHRVKMVCQQKEYLFSLDQTSDQQSEHYFLSCQDQKQVTFILQQILSIEDMMDITAISQQTLSFSEIISQKSTFSFLIKYSTTLQLNFLLDFIKNENLSSSPFFTLRIFQTSKENEQLTIGTDKTINLSNCNKIKPIMNKYYDYEYGYLKSNLQDASMQSHSIYDYLDKISKSFPKYQNFTNQCILQSKNCQQLIFKIGTQFTISIPIVYLLNGINVFHCHQGFIKFFLEFQSIESIPPSQSRKDRRRLFQMSIQQIWNLSTIIPKMQQTNEKGLQLKLTYEGTYYYIPFQMKTVNKSDFRAECKKMQSKIEYSQRANDKFYLISPHSDKNKVNLLITQAILPSYVFQIVSSSAISVQILISNQIILEGSIETSVLSKINGREIRHLLSSSDGQQKIVIMLSFTEIQQINQSYNSFYTIKHRLFFAQAEESDDYLYDIQICKITDGKKSNKNKLKAKMVAQLKKDKSQGVFLKQFSQNGFFSKNTQIELDIKLRKMYYNEQLNFFDNSVLIQKKIVLNPSAESILAKNSISIILQPQTFDGVELDFYDDTCKKRLKYYMQFYHKKSAFFDYKDSSYAIKIPPAMWAMNNSFFSQTGSFQISSHMNRRKNNISKASVSSNNYQQIVIDHYNYNDGISVSGQKGIGYNKFMNAIKGRCEVIKDRVVWSPQSDWFYGMINLQNANFYFLIKRLFDPYQEKNKESSNESRKTDSKPKSDRSDKHKIDPFAKTINNMELFKLKKKKNQLVNEGRQLTARYVQRQEKITMLNRKIADLDQINRKKEAQQKEYKSKEPKQISKQTAKAKELYYSICECGARNPKFHGYCEQCLKKMRKSYEVISKEYKQKTYEFQKHMFDQFNQKDKIQRLKQKIKNYKQGKIDFSQDGKASDSTEHMLKDLQQKNLKRCIQEYKIDLFQIQEEKQSLIQTSNYQQQTLQSKIKKEDQQIFKLSQQLEDLKRQLRELKQSIKEHNKQSA